MKVTLAFDVYGTLIDTHGVVQVLEGMVGERAREFSRTWRDKQLEYSFRRGLMQNYQTFAVCTSQALDYTCGVYQVVLGADRKQRLLDTYRVLPAFPDAREGLARLQGAGVRLFAFSNGGAEAVESLLDNADLREFFLDVVSCDELKSFKPNPAVYAHFLRRAEAVACEAWMISGNPFDVLGARSAGLRAAWVKRSPAEVFDPWGTEPDLIVAHLTELAGRIPLPAERAAAGSQ